MYQSALRTRQVRAGVCGGAVALLQQERRVVVRRDGLGDLQPRSPRGAQVQRGAAAGARLLVSTPCCVLLCKNRPSPHLGVVKGD